MHGTGSTAFRLHFLNHYRLPKQVLPAFGSPRVYVLGHGRRRGDGIDGSNLREHIAHVSGGLVTITSDKLFFFCHLNKILINVFVLIEKPEKPKGYLVVFSHFGVVSGIYGIVIISNLARSSGIANAEFSFFIYDIVVFLVALVH